MTISHHPPDDLLLSYAAGTTDEATALVLATHLALCPLCRQSVAEAEAVGGQLLEEMPEAPLSPDAVQSALSRLDAPVVRERASEHPPYDVPEPLRSYIGGGLDAVKWRKISDGVSYMPLFRTGKARTYLVRFKPGSSVGMHTHHGEELTLCLAGGYSDKAGTYARGDLQWSTPDILHEPIGDPGEDCIALAASTARLKFSNPIAGLIGYLFGF